MFKNIRIIAVLAAIAAAATAAFSQPAPKVVTVDRARAYKEYWKTEDYMAKLKRRQDDGQEELNQQQVRLKEIADQVRQVEERIQNPALNKEAKDRELAERDKLVQTFQAGREAMEQYAQNLDTTLQQQHNINQNMMLEEIDKIVNEIGKGKGATLIFDSSAGSVLFADPAYDITPAVIAEINKSRPAAPKPAATP